ncbi:MAG TPA: tetratricopeptide repeat protein, partial [Pyrinomonadaceae bacterium]|nr:tetratricopeptide repeat protein [Pyrinomonadaceae bacterium]
MQSRPRLIAALPLCLALLLCAHTARAQSAAGPTGNATDMNVHQPPTPAAKGVRLTLVRVVPKLDASGNPLKNAAGANIMEEAGALGSMVVPVTENSESGGCTTSLPQEQLQHHFEVGERFSIRIDNESDVVVYPTVFNKSASGKASILVPEPGAMLKLAPGESFRSYEFSITPPPGVESFKLVATTRETDFFTYMEGMGGTRGGTDESAMANLGAVFSAFGRFERSVEFYEKLLTRSENLGPCEASVRNNLGLARYGRSEYGEAMRQFKLALDIARRSSDRDARAGQATALNNLGLVYSSLDDNRAAIEHYTQSLEIKRALNDEAGAGVSLNNLGLAHVIEGENDKAHDYYRQALAIAERQRDRATEGVVHLNISRVFRNKGKFKEALDYSARSLDLARETGNRSGEGLAHNSLGLALASLARHEESIGHFEQARAIFTGLGNRAAAGIALSNLMFAFKTLGQPTVAVLYGKESVNAFQEIRTGLHSLDRSLQRGFLEARGDTYRELADLLISLGRLPEAQNVLGMLKEEEYSRFVQRDAGEIKALAPAELLPQEKAALESYVKIAEPVTAIGARWGVLEARRLSLQQTGKRLEGAELAEYESLSRQLDAANGAFNAFVRLKLPKELPEPAIRTIEENRGLQANLQKWGAGVVSLYTIVGKDRYRVILTTPSTQTDGRHEITAEALNKMVLEFRELVQHRCACFDPRPLGAELYRILIKPVEKDLDGARAQTLVWSLDGVLRYLPVAALYDEERKKYV